MYYFNSFLFENLPRLFGLSEKGVSEKVYGRSYMYKRKIENQGNILVQDIIMVCNTFHLSLTGFITIVPPDESLANLFKYVISEKDFKPIRFMPENIRFLYGPQGISKISSLAEFSRKNEISPTSIVRWQNPEVGGCTINWLIKVCNRYGVDIDVFLEDENEELEKYTATELQISPQVWQEISDLKEAIREYRKEKRELEEENRKLRIKVKEAECLSEENTEYSYSKSQVRDWNANWQLLENFYLVVGESKNRVLRNAGIQNYSNLFFEGNMLVTSLVKLCNKYHISTRHVFYRENGITPQLKLYSFYRSENWKPIVFHPEYINDFFGKDSVTGMSRTEISKQIGVGDWKLRSWRKVKSAMRIKDLLDVCNKLNVTPYCLITDQNRTDLSVDMTSSEILLEENRMLRQQIIRLKEKLNKRSGEPALPLDE